VNFGRAELTGLKLSSADGMGVDELKPDSESIFSVSDIRELDPNTLAQLRLVVLASCDSAVSLDIGPANEYPSLPGAWILAGAPAVIGAIWPIGAVETKHFAQRVVELELGGLSAACACRRAILEMRDGKLPDYKHAPVKGDISTDTASGSVDITLATAHRHTSKEQEQASGASATLITVRDRARGAPPMEFKPADDRRPKRNALEPRPSPYHWAAYAVWGA
jgi:CHAT domain-containing protein